ncbi:HNH endonuclease [Streptantibioticus rubrisoli]|uniref:HNH endonuclease n=1 Tax=Streptantibioticus rubrisoli TaxID=1387313 RepID=A0ABT1PKB6_9ACTN|nr:HNH endonuclease [Streptantibioticus rubrisoli]MCQ4045807.1 HNH endonuclease [Streptantibioticus rubrisoli]
MSITNPAEPRRHQSELHQPAGDVPLFGGEVGEADGAAPTSPVDWGRLLADGETVARYWSHVLRRGPDECWWWTGGLIPTAHGTFRAGSHTTGTSRVVPAHLFGYRLAHGADSIPAGQVCRHTCDEPPCQNPAHWILGTRGDNNRDAAARRRLAGHALADVRGPIGRARAVQAAIAAAPGPEHLDAAIAAALAAGNPSSAHQDSLF